MSLFIQQNKKDRRPLVLLVAGFSILASNVILPVEPGALSNFFLFQPDAHKKEVIYRAPLSTISKQIEQWVKEETADRKGRLFQLSFSRDHAVSPVLVQEKYELFAISPRYSFFFNKPLSINRADKNTLAMLSGIGPHLAENITAHLHSQGRLYSKNDLVKIPGIGKNLAARLGPALSFD